MTQPEALRLADELTEPISGYPEPTDLESKAAAELRRLHEVNQALLEALEYLLMNYVPFAYRNDTKVLSARAAIAKAGEA